jgi:Tfp pilus assembly protein PilO
MKKYTPLILIILSIIIFFVFIDPQYEEIQVLNKQKRDNDNMLGLSRELQRKRDQLQSDYNSISLEERRQLERLLPDTVDNVRLVLDINNIAESRGINIQNIDITRDTGAQTQQGQQRNTAMVAGAVDRVSDIGTIRLGFTVTASYDVFKSFLRDLEETLRVVDVRSLNIRTSQTGFFELRRGA